MLSHSVGWKGADARPPDAPGLALFRDLGFRSRVKLEILLESKRTARRSYGRFPRQHSELTFSFDSIGREVRLINRQNDGKRLPFRQIHERGSSLGLPSYPSNGRDWPASRGGETRDWVRLGKKFATL